MGAGILLLPQQSECSQPLRSEELLSFPVVHNAWSSEMLMDLYHYSIVSRCRAQGGSD